MRCRGAARWRATIRTPHERKLKIPISLVGVMAAGAEGPVGTGMISGPQYRNLMQHYEKTGIISQSARQAGVERKTAGKYVRCGGAALCPSGALPSLPKGPICWTPIAPRPIWPTCGAGTSHSPWPRLPSARPSPTSACGRSITRGATAWKPTCSSPASVWRLGRSLESSRTGRGHGSRAAQLVESVATLPSMDVGEAGYRGVRLFDLGLRTIAKPDENLAGLVRPSRPETGQSLLTHRNHRRENRLAGTGTP